MKFFKNTQKIQQFKKGEAMKLKMISQNDLGYLRLLIDLITLIDENKKESRENTEVSGLIFN